MSQTQQFIIENTNIWPNIDTSTAMNISSLIIRNTTFQLIPNLNKQFPNLRELIVNDNQFLTVLSSLPENLEVLNCENNALVALPTISTTKLRTILCTGNHIKEIPTLPSTIRECNIDISQLNTWF